VDAKATALPDAGELREPIHSRSVTLSSERLRVIAKMDLVEVEGGVVTPVDYKHGHPRDGAEGLELWPSDRAQLAVQGIVLRENSRRLGRMGKHCRPTHVTPNGRERHVMPASVASARRNHFARGHC
jgi:hypothetical protein